MCVVSYGNVVPHTAMGKALVMVFSVAANGVLAMALEALAALFSSAVLAEKLSV